METMEKYQLVERSIIKKYRREIWKRFIAAVNQYELISEGDKIAVCMSGGKDSTLMAKCLQELQRHSRFPFELEFLVMDPGYNEINRRVIEDNVRLLNIPARIFDTRIYDIVAGMGGSPCYMCARMRRGNLYSKARELGCNKIALGHHFDDAIETTLLSMFYGAEVKTMMPKLHSTNFQGMELIRPLYMVREADILAWKRYNGLEFIQCACRFTENCSVNEDSGSKRLEMKNLIKKFRAVNPNIDINIFNSMHNINMGAVLGYSDGTGKHSFLEGYESRRRLSPDGGEEDE